MGSGGVSGSNAGHDLMIRHFRQRLLWPLQLLPRDDDGRAASPGLRCSTCLASPWREAAATRSGPFQERHYNEFVTFLPYVQRFLYGDGPRDGSERTGGGSSMRLLRRDDVAGGAPAPAPASRRCELLIEHVDLYFFHDVDVVMLHVEVHADELPLPVVQELLDRFGRAYPPGWDDDGRALHCAGEVEWLGAGRPDAVRVGRRPSATPSSTSSAATARRGWRRTGAGCCSRWARTRTRSRRRHGRAAGAPDRVPPHAGAGLAGAGRSGRAGPRRLHPPRAGGRAGQPTGRGAERLPFAERHVADFESPPLLRPLLARRRRGALHPLPVLRPRAGRGRARGLGLLHRPRARRARRSSATSTS